jgi:membrane-bound lytic murein transglycosylase
MDRDNIDDFFIQADKGEIHLKIDTPFDFPDRTCHWGGYDTQSRIEIKSSNYSVKGQVYISTGNIYNFFRQLEECYKTLRGTATLESYEKNLFIKLDFDGLGHAKITGVFNEMHDLNKLEFEMKTDQTFLVDTLSSLTQIHKKFGDNKGVTVK